MSNKKFYIVLVLLFFISYGLIAQNPVQNQEKYWYYRNRLLNDFMLVGEGQGMSIPAERRGPHLAGETSGDVLDFWADETCNLGMYIAVLATEIKLLKDNGQDAGNSIRELYYALKAVNRLDENAEYYWRLPPPPNAGYSLPPQPQAGDLNGFFVRSDMTSDFVSNNWQHFNKGNSSFTVNRNHSSMNKDDFSYKPSSEESLDQVVNLMLGTAFVSEFINDTYNGLDLNQEAKDITHRMIMHMKNSSPVGWVVKNPITGGAVGGGNNSNGSAAYPYSYGFAEAACHIVRDPSGFFSTIYPIACFKYHDLTTSASFPVFQGMKDFVDCPTSVAWQALGVLPESNFPCDACQEMYKPEMLAALGHCYYQCPNPLSTNCFIDLLPSINATGEFLSLQASSTHMEILPLIHQVLHGGINFIGKNTYESFLNSAPCTGPYNLGNCNYASYDWSAPVKWRQPERRGAGCPLQEGDPGCTDHWYGEYNGLDYMLLYNLYHIVHPDEADQQSFFLDYVNGGFAKYVNQMDESVTIDFPLTIDLNTNPFPPVHVPNYITLGNHAIPFGINAFSTISSTSHISSDGDMKFRAGSEIALLPGFSVDAGADFGAYIEPFHCNSPGDQYIRTANDTSKSSSAYGLTSFVSTASVTDHHPYIPSSTPLDPITPTAKPTAITKPEISITPNPTNGLFSIATPENILTEIFIYNDLGQLIYQRAAYSPLQIDLTAQPKGIYFVKTQNLGKIYSEKVVVK